MPDIIPMTMTMRQGIGMTSQQIDAALALANTKDRQHREENMPVIVAALELAQHLLGELDNLVRRIDAGEDVRVHDDEAVPSHLA